MRGWHFLHGPSSLSIESYIAKVIGKPHRVGITSCASMLSLSIAIKGVWVIVVSSFGGALCAESTMAILRCCGVLSSP